MVVVLEIGGAGHAHFPMPSAVVDPFDPVPTACQAADVVGQVSAVELRYRCAPDRFVLEFRSALNLVNVVVAREPCQPSAEVLSAALVVEDHRPRRRPRIVTAIDNADVQKSG